MQETQELIDIALSYAEDLEFSFGTLKGFPGQEVYSLTQFDNFEVQKQDFFFKISSKDFFENVLVKGERFNYYCFSKTYTFEIMSWKNNLVGWTTLQVSFIEVSDSV